MFVAFRFFWIHLHWHEKCMLVLLLAGHIGSHFQVLDTEKQLIELIPSLFSKTHEPPSDVILGSRLWQRAFCSLAFLASYLITLVLIEWLGRKAVQRATHEVTALLLNLSLGQSPFSREQYEHHFASLGSHRQNLQRSVTSLFVEFPRKLVACCHFLGALHSVSGEILMSALVVNVFFVAICGGVSLIRKKINTWVLGHTVASQILCSDVSHAIGTHQVDRRTAEFERRLEDHHGHLFRAATQDSVLCAGSEGTQGLVCQIMMGLILRHSHDSMSNVSLASVLYAVRASGKLVEKLGGVLDYVEEVIRQYPSFHYFLDLIDQLSCFQTGKIEIPSDEKKNSVSLRSLSLTFSPPADLTCSSHFDLEKIRSQGKVMALRGPNGCGKTTSLSRLLEISFPLAHQTSLPPLFLSHPAQLNDPLPISVYYDQIGFAQQAFPFTDDTVEDYLKAVSQQPACFDTSSSISGVFRDLKLFLHLDADLQADGLFEKAIHPFAAFPHQKVRQLSGGQAKMLQLLAAMVKVCLSSPSVTGILIFDEPTNALDHDKKLLLSRFILPALLERHLIVLLVTHDPTLLLHVPHLWLDFFDQSS